MDIINIMSIIGLTNSNFQSGNGGRLLMLKVPRGGYSFVTFKTETCPQCVNFAPVLNQLSRSENRVNFYVIDVGRYKNVVGMSQTTNTPIKHVPMCIFYVNGKPSALYKGSRDLNSIRSFLSTMVSRFPINNNNFVQNPQYYNQQQNGPVPTQGIVNSGQAMRGQNFGLGMSLNEMEEKHNKSHPSVVPDGVIPHNVPWVNYKKLGIDYN